MVLPLSNCNDVHIETANKNVPILENDNTVPNTVSIIENDDTVPNADDERENAPKIANVVTEVKDNITNNQNNVRDLT